MITTKDLLDSLKLQDICPKCGVNYRELEESLKESPQGENFRIAITIIENCPVCKMRFEGVK